MLSQPLADHAAAQTAGPALGQTEGLSLGHYGLSVPTMPASMPFARNAEIYGENEPAKYFYKVVSGAVRTYRVLSDGRRQIAGFYLPGDIFGVECGETHSFSAEAITACRALVIKRAGLVSLADRDSDIARKLWTMTARELQRAQGHVTLLVKTAQERVVGFLLDMAGRRDASSNEIELPMSRQDIADYLGLTIETVSRTLTQLEKTEAIAVPTSRRIVLRNRAALDRMNGGSEEFEA